MQPLRTKQRATRLCTHAHAAASSALSHAQAHTAGGLGSSCLAEEQEASHAGCLFHAGCMPRLQVGSAGLACVGHDGCCSLASLHVIPGSGQVVLVMQGPSRTGHDHRHSQRSSCCCPVQRRPPHAAAVSPRRILATCTGRQQHQLARGRQGKLVRVCTADMRIATAVVQPYAASTSLALGATEQVRANYVTCAAGGAVARSAAS